jgi:hypothetical protein
MQGKTFILVQLLRCSITSEEEHHVLVIVLVMTRIKTRDITDCMRKVRTEAVWLNPNCLEADCNLHPKNRSRLKKNTNRAFVKLGRSRSIVPLMMSYMFTVSMPWRLWNIEEVKNRLDCD